MVRNVSQQDNRLETTRARPGQPAEGVIQVASRGLHAFCAPPHTLLVLVPYISQSAVPVLQLLLVGSRTVYLGCAEQKDRGRVPRSCCFEVELEENACIAGERTPAGRTAQNSPCPI